MPAFAKKHWWLWLPVVVTLFLAARCLYLTGRTRLDSKLITRQVSVVDSLGRAEQKVHALRRQVQTARYETNSPAFAWMPLFTSFSKQIEALKAGREEREAYLNGVRVLMARAGAAVAALRTLPAPARERSRMEADYALRDVAGEIHGLRTHVRAGLSDRYAAVTAGWGTLISLLWMLYLMLVVDAIVVAVWRYRIPAEAPDPVNNAATESPVVDLATLGIAAEKVFRFAGVGVAVIDPQGRFVETNAALQKMLGYTEEEMKALTLGEVTASGRVGSRLRRIKHVTDDTFREAETFRHRDGSPRWGRVSMTSFSRDTRYCMMVVEDVTAQIRYEERSAEAARRESELKRLKDAFLGNINHELRTPLTVILGYVDVLGEDASPQQETALGAIREGAERLRNAIDSLLELAHLDRAAGPEERHAIDLRRPVTDAVEKLRASAVGKGLRLIYQEPDVPVFIEGDSAGMQRVARHLLENAIKFTDAGHVHVKIEKKAGRVRLHVRDTGIGLAAEHLPILSEAFRQGSMGETREYGGFGIGLTIARERIARMGGELTVTGEPGRGAHFVASFPAVEAPGRPAPRIIPAAEVFRRVAA